MSAPPTLIVRSLVGGVLSPVMALMASQRAFDCVPDCAVFADTLGEGHCGVCPAGCLKTGTPTGCERLGHPGRPPVRTYDHPGI